MEKRARKRILLFVLGFLLINGGLSVYFLKISSRNFKVARKDHRFWKGYDNQPIIIMGHSRPAKAIVPEELKNSIKYCSSAESIEKTYYRFKKILKKGTPQLLILPAGYCYVAMDQAEYAIADFFWKRYLNYPELARITRDYETYYSRMIKAYAFPYHRYPYVKLKDWNDEAMVRFRDDYPSMSDEERQELANRVVSYQARNKGIEAPASLKYLDMLITLAQKNDVKLLFVKYPVTNYYSDAGEAEAMSSKRDPDAIEKLVRKQEGVMYLDLERSLDHCETCFQDVQHLSREGAIQFTELFKEEVKRQFNIDL